MGDTTFNDSKIALSEFNEAQFQILRLHDCWNDCNRFIKQGNFDQWKWTLDVAWNELFPDVQKIKKKGGKEWYLKEFSKCNKRIQIAKTKNQTYFALMKKHQFLKNLQDDVGKGSKRASTYGDDLMT